MAVARAKSKPRGGARRRAVGYPGHIRIIGGRWRSRRLPVLAAEGLRPTPDRIRETLFNWLAPYIAGARCLDLFAGTGALCLEALSRGANEVVMVERSADALRQLRANIDVLGATGAEAVQLDALTYLRGHSRAFDVVFLDPPFAAAVEMIRDCSALLGSGWIRPGGLVYVEAPSSLPELLLPVGWVARKKGVAGQVSYQLFQVPPAPG